MRSGPIGSPDTDKNDEKLVNAAEQYLAELRQAARDGLFGSVYSRVTFQGGTYNQAQLIAVPRQIH